MHCQKLRYAFTCTTLYVLSFCFIDSFFIKERAKIFAYIEKLVELKNSGIQPKENLSKHLEDGIFELRVSFENRISRNFYFYESDKRIIFTHGFVKKEQKPPKG